MAIWCLQCFWIQLVCYLCYLKDLFWACWSFRMVRHVYLCIDDLWDFLVLCPDLMLILNCVLAVILSKTFIEALIVLYRIICSVCMHISYLLDHLSLLLTFCLMNKLNCIRLEWKLKKMTLVFGTVTECIQVVKCGWRITLTPRYTGDTGIN